jgi:hypothetical protein
VKSPRIEIVGTLALPASCSIPSLDVQNIPVVFNEPLDARIDHLKIKASSGKIENNSKNLRLVNSTSLELGAGEILGDWSLPRDSFSVNVKAGTIDIDVFPLDIAAADYNTEFRTDVRAGQTKVDIHSPVSEDRFPQKMTSKHGGGAGNFKLKYPSAWAGIVKVDGNGAGKVEIEAESMVAISDNNGRIKKATIGEGNSRMDLELQAGNIELEFYD